MSSAILIQFAAPLLAAFAGAFVGWWMRGRPASKVKKTIEPSQKHVAAHALQHLQAAAETVRSCVEQHSECIRAIQSQLDESPSSEPVIITKLAESIVESNELAQHQCNDIRQELHAKRQEIHDFLANTDRLLFTFASLDRQTQAYRQVLSSLEVLATELSREIKGHGQRLQKISGGLENGSNASEEGLTSAVTQILDATASLEQRVASTERRIAVHAKSVEMQAVLAHADLLTSLPNRRALVAELQRAASHGGHSPLATVLLVDLDSFALVNSEYGHQGGDVILRQAAAEIKKMGRGRDLIARFGGDTFAIVLNQTTIHDSLPLAERIRKRLQETQFSHGAHPLRLTASVGIAQLRPEELREAAMDRAELALAAAKQAGGNLCFRHDGQECVPVASVFGVKTERAAEDSLSLAALWRDSTNDNQEDPATKAARANETAAEANLSGRSLFAANLGRRLAEWKRGGMSVSVAVLRVDQMDDLVARFGDQGQTFLRQVLGKLLEAETRDMDERCEFENGLYALLLPATDESNALMVAERLCSQMRQCKVRMGKDLWDLTASVGVAHCTMNDRVMDIMLSAEGALANAVNGGGDQVCVGQTVQEPRAAARI
jgi:diguanylate cyclase